MNYFGDPALFLVALAGSYVLGSLNGAQLLHHLKRSRWPQHITRIGTKNAGAQNVWMNVGRESGILVFLIDFLKAALGVYLARSLGLSGAGVFLAGTFVIVGHNWPLFFHFRGGRGFASLLGSFYAFDLATALVGSIIMLPFALLRFAGVTPFVLLCVGAVMHYTVFGWPMVVIHLFTALVLYARRVHATWHEFSVSRRKIFVLLNNLLYDRATNKPPALRDLFR